jgi:hypothetical protein
VSGAWLCARGPVEKSPAPILSASCLAARSYEDCHFNFSLHKQMKVIRQQAIMEDTKGETLLAAFEQVEE